MSFQERDHQQCGDHYENAVQHRGVPAHRTRVHIGRTPHGHTGDGQSAERAGDDVGGALSEQFAVEAGTPDLGGQARAARHQLVHGDRAEQ
ncbi:hypothetical protein SPURM210S_05630 [Streptomyces purpurascens]